MAFLPFAYQSKAAPVTIAPGGGGETEEERARRLRQAALAQEPAPRYPASIPLDYDPTNYVERADNAATTPVGPPAVDPKVLASVAPQQPMADPNLEAIRARHNAQRASQGLGPDAPVDNIATQTDDPTVVYKGGRPETAYGPDRLAAQRALQERVNEYEPRKGPKWLRVVAAALQGAGVVGDVSRGDSRSAARNVLGAVSTLTNPRMAEENWKREKQAEVGGAINSIYDQRKDAAQIEHIAAQTDKIKNPPKTLRKVRLLKNNKGLYVAVDAETGLDSDGNQVQGTTPADSNDWVLHVNEKGEYVPVNKKTGLGQDGQPVKGKSMVQLSDGTYVDATSKYTADRQFGREDREVDLANQKSKQENEQLQKQVDNWTIERNQLDEALRTTPQMIQKTRINENREDEKYDAPNPVYDDYMGRRRAVNDKILGVQFKPIIKAPPRASGATPPGANEKKYKVPAKFL